MSTATTFPKANRSAAPAAGVLALAGNAMLPGQLGNIDAYIQSVNRIPMLTPGEGKAVRERLPRTRRPRGRASPRALASAPGGVDRAQLSGLWPAARRPDPGRQYRPDESRQALRPRAERAARVVRDALDQGRDPRICAAELAHGQGRDDEGAAQAVLQLAQSQAGPAVLLAGRDRRPREGTERQA